MVVYSFDSSLFSCIDIIVATAASNHIQDGANTHADSDDPADPDVQLGEGQRCAENIEKRLDPEGVDEGAVLVDKGDFHDCAKEEKTEEAVVAFDDPGIDAELIICNRENGEEDCKCAESDR